MNRIDKFYDKMLKTSYFVESKEYVTVLYYEYNIDDIHNDSLCYDVLITCLASPDAAKHNIIETYNSLNTEKIDSKTSLREVISKVNQYKDQSEFFIMFHLLREHDGIIASPYVENSFMKTWLNESVVNHIIERFSKKTD